MLVASREPFSAQLPIPGLPVRAGCIDEGGKKPIGTRFASHVLRMPLNTDVEGVSRIFDRFDDSVRRFSRDPEVTSDSANRLMVSAIDVERAGANQFRDSGAGENHHIVARAVRRVAFMLERIRKLRANVLDQGSARDHCHQLNSEADAESRNQSFVSQTGERKISILPSAVHGLDGSVRRFAVAGGIAIEAAGEKDPIEVLCEFASVLGLRRNEQRNSACSPYRVDVAEINECALPLLAPRG